MCSERDGDRSLSSLCGHPETSPKPGATPQSPPPGAQPARCSSCKGSRESSLFPNISRESFVAGSIHPALGEGSGWEERDRRLVVPKCTGGFRNSKAWARSLLLVFAVTQYAPDVRAIWEETIKASGNGY